MEQTDGKENVNTSLGVSELVSPESSESHPLPGDDKCQLGGGETGEIPTSKKPTCVVVLGMAGSGKTSFLGQVSKLCKDAAFVNLDPAVLGKLPYSANIDIRNTINYNEVMSTFGLGPNGAIIASLNLFSTKIFDVISLILEKNYKTVFFDTPGQIEVFNWSASGSIILESLASEMPTCITYIVDVPRCTNNLITFTSNMLYACSVMYKSRLPVELVLNKNDVIHHKQIVDWIRDFEEFQKALDRQENENQSYSFSLARSLSLALDEFYNSLSAVGFSSVTGDGWPELSNAINRLREQYLQEYLPYYEELKRSKCVERKAQSSTEKSQQTMLVGTPAYFKPSTEDSS